MFDIIIPYLKCSCGSSNNDDDYWWSPGHGWNGSVTGFERRKGCRDPDHWSYKYAPRAHKDRLPDYVAERHSTMPRGVSAVKKDRKGDYSSRRSPQQPQRGNYVPPYVSDPSPTSSRRSSVSRPHWERKQPATDANVIIVDDKV
ncbi:hypothetical protein MGN70_012933 [Eutypa lata]|nr:hypothetical protein MGN70_012933 [Eutypa lata]